MSVLKSLKLASAAPANVSSDPKQRMRDKVVQGLAEQKEAITAKLEGRHYQPTHLVTRKNEAGERVRVEAPRRIRRGWFQCMVRLRSARRNGSPRRPCFSVSGLFVGGARPSHNGSRWDAFLTRRPDPRIYCHHQVRRTPFVADTSSTGTIRLRIRSDPRCHRFLLAGRQLAA
jgi:hypothetical protein